METTALVPYQFPGLIHWCDVQAGYVGSGFGEAYGYTPSETTRCACYEGDLAVELEVVEDAH